MPGSIAPALRTAMSADHAVLVKRPRVVMAAAAREEKLFMGAFGWCFLIFE